MQSHAFIYEGVLFTLYKIINEIINGIIKHIQLRGSTLSSHTGAPFAQDFSTWIDNYLFALTLI